MSPKPNRGGARKGSGRKATGRTQQAVSLPLGLIDLARQEQARRDPEKVSIGSIIAEWAMANR
jgi:hypothetical protein